MSSIDERVVSMKFNNGGFLNGIRGVLEGLAALKSASQLNGASNGIDELGRAASRFSLGNMLSSVSGVSAGFAAMATVAITALSNITNKAINAGLALAKSLTVDPIKQGLQEYETNLNSIQTILANTQSKGSTLGDVNKALGELNTYSDKTIYNFGEMARNIGTFTAAGVDLDTSVQSIKGIANLAAISGSSSQQASTAMYQLSQALSTGRVTLMDWNSVVNAGMGGEVFQTNIKETARAHGIGVDEIIKNEGSFRDSLQTGWLTSEILTESLSKFTGDLTDTQLQQMGYTADQIVAIQKVAQSASDAATKIKTVSQLIGTLQEAAGSGWSQTFQLLFGDFEEAKVLFTNVNNVLSGMIGRQADARNKMIGEFKELGGRTAVINAISNAFNALLAVIKPIKEAFRDIFPAVTGAQLAAGAKALEAFTQKLMISGPAAENLKRTFRGVFAVLDIGLAVIQGLIGVLGRLLGVIFSGTGGFLEFTGSIGDFLVSVRNAVRNGTALSAFFTKLGDILLVPIKLVQAFAGALKDAFLGLASGDFGNLAGSLKPLEAVGNAVLGVLRSLGAAFPRILSFFAPLTAKLKSFLGNLATSISEGLANVDYNAVLDGINTGLFAGLVLIIKKFLSGGLNFKADLGGGLVSKIKDTFGALTDTLKSMQASIQAETILKIAGAIGILTLAVIGISLIDSGALTKSLVAISVMFAQLAAGVKVLEATTGIIGAAKLAVIAAGLILLSVAIGILAISVGALSGLSWEEIAKGLTGVASGLSALVGASILLQGSTAGLLRAGIGMTAISVALLVLSAAVRSFAGMSWGELAKGMAAIAVSLVILVGALRLMSGGVVGAAALLIVSIALNAVAPVLQKFGEMNWGSIAKAVTLLAASLAIIAGAMYIMPGAIAGATALLVVGAALRLIAPVMEQYGAMDWGAIAKALTLLAGSLLIIAGGLFLMTAALPGAAALIVVAAALAIIAPILVVIGSLSWGTILTALGALAAVFILLGVAGALLAPVVPVLVGLGIAIGLLGAGVGIAAAGIGLLALGIALLITAVIAGAVAVATFGVAILGIVPALASALADGVVAFIAGLAAAAPRLLAAGVALITTLLDAIQTVAPKIIETFTKLMISLLDALDKLAPRILESFTKLVLGMLNAAEKLIPQYIDTANKIITALLDAVKNIGPQIIQTLGVLLAALVTELTKRIPEFATKATGMITAFLNAIAAQVGPMVTAGTNIVVNVINGITANQQRVIDAGKNMIVQLIIGIAQSIAGGAGQLLTAAANLGGNIIQGLVNGIRNGIATVASAAREAATSALNAAKSALGVKSPSREFYKIGGWSTEGLANGLTETSGVVDKAASQVGKNATYSLQKAMSALEIDVPVDFNPTIRPVLDLTQVEKEAGKLGGLLGKNDISPGAAYKQAAALSRAKDVATQRTVEQTAQVAPVTTYNYTQNNTSPKALSAGDIYRQTKNQLSTVRGTRS